MRTSCLMTMLCVAVLALSPVGHAIGGSFSHAIDCEIGVNYNNPQFWTDMNDDIIPGLLSQAITTYDVNRRRDLGDFMNIVKVTNMGVVVCDLNVDIDIEDVAAKLNVANDAFTVTPDSYDSHKLHLALDLSDAWVTFVLDVYINCGIITPIDRQVDFRVSGFSGSMAIDYNVSGGELAVTRIDEIKLNIKSISYDKDDLNIIQEAAASIGVSYVMSGECSGFGTLEECVSDYISKAIARDEGIQEDLISVINDSVLKGLNDLLGFQVSTSIGDLSLSANISLGDLAVRDAYPAVETKWPCSLTLRGNEEECTEAMDFGSGSGSIKSGKETDGTLEIELPYLLLEAFLTGYGKAGEFCYGPFTYSGGGRDIDVTLAPAGNISLSPGSYEYTLFYWTNENNPDVIPPDYELGIYKGEDTGLQMDLPVEIHAAKGFNIDASTVIHIVGKLATDADNSLMFEMKQAWIDEITGTAEIGSRSSAFHLKKMTDQINDELSRTFYERRKLEITYSRVCPTVEYVICRLTETKSCGPSCELDFGIGPVQIMDTGRSYCASDFSYNTRSLSVGLSLGVSGYSLSCTECPELPDVVEAVFDMSDHKRAAEIQNWIIEEMTRDAAAFDELVKQLIRGDQIKTIRDLVTIDETTPFPRQDIREFMDVRVYTSPERAHHTDARQYFR
jgi:hypothetical protein